MFFAIKSIMPHKVHVSENHGNIFFPCLMTFKKQHEINKLSGLEVLLGLIH